MAGLPGRTSSTPGFKRISIDTSRKMTVKGRSGPRIH